MAYFATEYTIHFDDTMAYGSHHFLTAFKFQCTSRESFLFGERIYDVPGVKDALGQVHLLTADAYTRNLHPAQLGDRVAILLSLEEWGRSSARFCYRVVGAQGQKICAGFQTLICADAKTQSPIALPSPLRQAMDAMREIEEPQATESFRDCVLAGGSKLDRLFGDTEREVALRFLSQRYPSPTVIAPAAPTQEAPTQVDDSQVAESMESPPVEAWAFAGQSAFDAQLLSARIAAYARTAPTASRELEQCAAIARESIGGDAQALVSGSPVQCAAAVKDQPDLSQVAIHLQNVLGALLWQARGHSAGILLGHSFGEIAALGVGGCFDLPTGVRIVCMRVRAIADHAPPDGGLLVVSSDRNTVLTEAALLGLRQVVIAGRNHARQTVASGPKEELQRLQEYLASVGVDAAIIASPTSFHHPALRVAAARWLEELRTLSINSPGLDVYSPIGRRFIAADDDIAAVLASQLLKPFDLQRGVVDAISGGATKFVDCGSSGALARLIAKAGAGDSEVCLVEAENDSAAPRATYDGSGTARAVRPTCDNPFESDRTACAAPLSDTNARPQERSAVSQVNGRPAAEQLESSSERYTVPSVAIVGQGCILPGGACSPGQLFEAIDEQRNGLVDQRLHDPHWSEEFYAEQLTPDRSNSHLSGRVRDEDIVVPPGVEANIFNSFTRTQKLLCIALAPCIASLDGAHRILCLIGATADGFEDQDDVSALRYLGLDPSDPEIDSRLNTAGSAWHTPHSAVQEVFDRLVRPGLKVTLVDAACASSLYTVALGMQALETDKTDAVIAGGFFCPGPGNSCLFSQFRGTTSTGCRPFDAGADGVVFSEGAALVTLRRAADAQRLGLTVCATVRGAGLSSDGRSTSANVPQSKGQLISLQRCYTNYAIDPASITAIEGHGTSTPVGDSTEVETLRQHFDGCRANPIPLHSLKGLLGHAGWAAGTASVIAACEYMRRGIFPAQAGYRNPSKAMQAAAGTLMVATQPVPLPEQGCRIAVDGFGFGGANAHLVLEAPAADAVQAAVRVARPAPAERDNELVFVAYHQEHPQLATAGGLQFDRSQVKLPKRHVILPELADDMDISQKLTVIAAEEVIAQIPQFDDRLRRDTSLVLAMRGKTQRGVEATARIMTPRYRRKLQADSRRSLRAGNTSMTPGQPSNPGQERRLTLLKAAYDHARPSGPYTLQCMMPNVAAGRAALLHNLNGPNFVVDSAANSLEAALSSAALLLQSGEKDGTKLAIIAAVEATSRAVPVGESLSREDEFAVAFAVTTRRLAEERGLEMIVSVDEALNSAGHGLERSAVPTIQEKIAALVQSLESASVATSPSLEAESRKPRGGSTTSAATDVVQVALPRLPKRADAPSTMLKPAAKPDCPIHAPVWVQKPVLMGRTEGCHPQPASMLVLAPAQRSHVEQLLAVLPKHCERFLVAVVSSSQAELAPFVGQPNMVAVDLTDTANMSSALDRIQELGADIVSVVAPVSDWDFNATLSRVAGDNSLCELLFLVAQRERERLERGQIELWGLLLDAWNGEVHPASGPIAGLLKSINREFPAARTGTICARDRELSAALERLQTERAQSVREQEVVWDQDVRLVRRLRRTSSDGTNSGATLSKQAYTLDVDSVVVATGGARGVTAVMLDCLLRDYGCTVIALGRSPLEAGPENWQDAAVEKEFYQQYLQAHPHASAGELRKELDATRARWEAHHTIQKLSALGGQVEYMVVDVTDRDQVTDAIGRIASRYGKIDLLLHGAGVQHSKRLEHRSLAEFRQTFSVKVAGLNNLLAGCDAHFGSQVNTHVLTSAYSVFGNDGQHDYGAANETLDRLSALKASSSPAASSSIAWLAWEGIGMTRGSEYRALAKRRKLSVVDAPLGQRLFREVLAGQSASAIHVPMTAAEHIEYGIKTVPASTRASAGTILEVGVELAGIECLPFHRIRDIPTLPGAWILDRLVNTGLQLASGSQRITNVAVENLAFMRFVRLAHNLEPNLRVIAEKVGDGIDVWMVADVLHPTGLLLSKDVVCATAKLSFGGENVLPSVSSICSSEGQRSNQFVRDPYCDSNRREVSLSGPFDCLTNIEISQHLRRAQFRPDRRRNDLGDIPALLLDAAWRVGAMYAVSGQSDLFVPVRIGRMLLPVGKNTSCDAAWEIRSTVPRPENRDVRWDRTEVFDRSGTLKIVVEDALATRLV